MPGTDKTTGLAITQGSKVSIALLVIIIGALFAVFSAAFDFKSWVTDEVQAVRSEQVEASRAVESAVITMTMQMKQVGTEVKEMKEAIIRQSEVAGDFRDRMTRVEARIDAVERAIK